MFKKIKIIILSLILVVSSSSSLFAESKLFYVVDEFDDYVIKLELDENFCKKFYTYKNNMLLYVSYYKDDGNLYMLIDGKEVIAVEVQNEYQGNISFVTSKAIKKAPSNFLLTNSGYVQKITISGDIIAAGQSAIRSAIVSAALASFGGAHAAISAASSSILSSLVVYIWENYSTYSTNVTRNSYVYNGCSWLLYNEFVYPGNYPIGAYAWTDNPSLGVASSVCKLASKTYPY